MNNLNFIRLLAVGPQRTASSWLDQAFRAHPRLALPTNVKETFFFDHFFYKGWDWYLSHFEQQPEDSLLVEVGATYFESTEARERIYENSPNTRILITVRNPIARTFSSFRHEYAKGRTGGDFFNAVAEHPRIVDAGRYSNLAPEWERTFGFEQILYIAQEDIESTPQSQMINICSFLGVEAVELPEELKNRYGQGTVPRYQWIAAAASRAATALRQAGLHRLIKVGKQLGLKRVYSGGNQEAFAMSRAVFDYLFKEHEPDICFLEKRLGRKFPHWRDPATYDLER